MNQQPQPLVLTAPSLRENCQTKIKCKKCNDTGKLLLDEVRPDGTKTGFKLDYEEGHPCPDCQPKTSEKRWCDNPHCVNGWVEEDEEPPYRKWTECLTCNRNYRYTRNDVDHPLLIPNMTNPNPVESRIDMARIFLWHERLVRVLRVLMPLYDEVGGSVNALCNKLNEHLDGQRIYPNRIHALLSGEKDVALNTGTVEMLEEALLNMGRDPSKVDFDKDPPSPVSPVDSSPPEKGSDTSHEGFASYRQVGGNHYEEEQGGEMHWDRQWRKFGRGYFIGQITKYVERAHKKNGVLDLEKAISFINKLIALEVSAALGTGPKPGKEEPLRADQLGKYVEGIDQCQSRWLR